MSTPMPELGGDDRFIGVPDNHAVPAVKSDFFKPGGSAQVGPKALGFGSLTIPTNAPHLPRYQTGAENAIVSLPPESLARLQIQLAEAGLIGPSTRVQVGVADDGTINAYKDLLGIANRYAITDSEALDFIKSQPGAVAGGATGADLLNGTAGEDEGGTTSQTHTTRFTRLDAESAADAAFQEALGEDASPKHIKALRKALNAYASANPAVVTTTSDGQGNTSTVSAGGIDAGGIQQIAQDFARAVPTHAEIQASTTYWNALESSLDAIGD